MVRNQEDILWRDIMPLEWDQQKYTTGFARLDEQHRTLFDGLNSLIVFLRNSSAADDPENSRKIVALLKFLGEYAVKHFEEEEAIFEQYSHPKAEANQESHQMFIRKYMEYQQKLSQGVVRRGLLIQIQIFLQSWLLNHIIHIDTSLRDYAAQETAESSLAQEKTGTFSRVLSLFQGK